MKALKGIAFLSIIIGVLLYLLGFVSKIQHWHDLLRGKSSGPILVLLGAVLYVSYLLIAQKNKK